jgi:hypothetical protein
MAQKCRFLQVGTLNLGDSQSLPENIVTWMPRGRYSVYIVVRKNAFFGLFLKRFVHINDQSRFNIDDSTKTSSGQT